METKNIKTYIDNLLGEEGVKFDVKADLQPNNYLYLFVTIAGAMVVGNLVNLLIAKITKE